MPPAATKPPTQRKRNRKRKRRAASTSSSSLDSSSDPTEDETPKTATKLVPVPSSVSQPQPESDLASDSSSSESSSSDEEDRTAEIPRGRQNITLKTPRQFSLSPSPPSAALPSFLPSENAGNDTGSKEKDLKDRFRQFWMTSVADGFQDDLEEIHKEPNLGTSRLALLIDSLAAGADVFSSSSNEKDTVNEMDVILN